LRARGGEKKSAELRVRGRGELTRGAAAAMDRDESQGIRTAAEETMRASLGHERTSFLI
jgi:hypothetical protein